MVARVQAWKTVLLERGWAEEASSARWALQSFGSDVADTVLRPRAGAQPLMVTVHTPSSQDHPHSVTIGAGDPAVALTTSPDCGCDACDHGSGSLLREIDEWVLSVVDGSLEAEVSAAGHSARTSFGGHGGSPTQGFREATAFTAEPWAEGWTARPLVPPMQSSQKSVGEELGIQLALTGHALRAALRRLLRMPPDKPAPQRYLTKD